MTPLSRGCSQTSAHPVRDLILSLAKLSRITRALAEQPV